MTMKIISFYLPQFHNIPENDEWWGPGFTEWTNVKKAEPLFDGHEQPKVPLNANYYNLLDNSVKKWQIELAKEAGIYGFCYYHYWFNGKLLLEKPMEQLLEDASLDFPFCVCWANEAWTKAWVNENKVLIPQHYGSTKEWKEHFDYLLPFFNDSRYIRVNGKPLFVIYRPEVVEPLNEMLDFWNELAIAEGFAGISFAYQQIGLDQLKGDNSRFDFDIEFQPVYAQIFNPTHVKGIKGTRFWKYVRAAKRKSFSAIERLTGNDLDRVSESLLSNSADVSTYNYDDRWEDILAMSPVTEKSVPGAFVSWDNTPRRGRKGTVCVGATPEKFYGYMKRLICKARHEYRSDFIFLTAWNEWAEGSYLEPDTFNGKGYLDAIRRALVETDELLGKSTE